MSVYANGNFISNVYANGVLQNYVYSNGTLVHSSASWTSVWTGSQMVCSGFPVSGTPIIGSVTFSTLGISTGTYRTKISGTLAIKLAKVTFTDIEVEDAYTLVATSGVRDGYLWVSSSGVDGRITNSTATSSISNLTITEIKRYI